MSVEAISKVETPHVTRIVQFSDGGKTSVRVTHRHFEGENGKDIIRDTCDIKNPEHKDIDKLLNNLGVAYGKNPESDAFKRVLNFINGIEKGEVQEMLAEAKKPDAQHAVSDAKTDPKPEATATQKGVTFSSETMKEAVANMRQDLHNKKDK